MEEVRGGREKGSGKSVEERGLIITRVVWVLLKIFRQILINGIRVDN